MMRSNAMRSLGIRHVGVALATAALVVGCSSPAASEPATDSPGQQTGTPSATDEPTRSGSARFGFSNWSMAYAPTAIAIDRLNEMGYDIEAIELGGNANQLQAATAGDIDITGLFQMIDAIESGFETRFFMGAISNEFIMVGKAGLDSCESLDGQRVGIQSEASFVGQLALQWFERECPDAAPEILVIEGSENRVGALLQDQLDASPVSLEDFALLENEAPGEFVITENFVESFPILRAAFAAPPEWIAENEQLVKDWIAVHLDVYEEIYADSSVLVAKAEELLPQMDAELIPEVAQLYLDSEIWYRDGDLTDESVQESIDFFDVTANYQQVTAPDEVIDRTYLDEVLADR